MSTPREFWLKVHKCDPAFDVFESEVSQTKPDFTKMMWQDFKDSVHVIEKNPEVVRKLECFDELVEELENSLSTVRTHAMQTYSKVSAEQAERIEELLKKAKGE